MAVATILIVEDDKSALQVLTEALEKESYATLRADTAFKARGLLAKNPPDLAIIDRKLPDGDGLTLCQEMRQQPSLSRIPVLFLTAKGSTVDRVVGLKMGADDYLTKPFSMEELLVRVETLLRRAGRLESRSILEWDGLRIDLESRKASLRGKAVALSAREFDLLTVFLSRKDRVLTRTFLLQSVWNYDGDAELSTRVVDVTVGHLKDKLGAWGDKIAAVRGFGYRLDPK